MADIDPADKDDEDTRGLVNAALNGDTAAWDRLVERFSGHVWSVPRSRTL